MRRATRIASSSRIYCFDPWGLPRICSAIVGSKRPADNPMLGSVGVQHLRRMVRRARSGISSGPLEENLRSGSGTAKLQKRIPDFRVHIVRTSR